MKLNEDAHRLVKLTNLIEARQTGIPDGFAKMLNISRSQLYNLIDELNEYGMEIHFDRTRNSFIRSGNTKIIVRKPITIVEECELAQINGGNCQKYLSVLFSGRSSTNLAL